MPPSRRPAPANRARLCRGGRRGAQAGGAHHQGDERNRRHDRDDSAGNSERGASMEQEIKEVQVGVEKTSASGAALREIIKLSEDVGDMIATIATAATEQSATTGQINSNVSQISGFDPGILVVSRDKLPNLLRICPAAGLRSAASREAVQFGIRGPQPIYLAASSRRNNENSGIWIHKSRRRKLQLAPHVQLNPPYYQRKAVPPFSAAASHRSASLETRVFIGKSLHRAKSF